VEDQFGVAEDHFRAIEDQPRDVVAHSEVRRTFP
jgi:hypothetical protein